MIADVNDYVECNYANLPEYKFAWKSVDDQILYFLSYTTYLYTLGMTETEAINEVYPASPRRMADTLRALEFFGQNVGWGKVVEYTVNAMYHNPEKPWRDRNMEIRLYIKAPLHFTEEVNKEILDIVKNYIDEFLDEELRNLYYASDIDLTGIRILTPEEVEYLFDLAEEYTKGTWFQTNFLYNRPILVWCNDKARVSLRKAVGAIALAVYKDDEDIPYHTNFIKIDDTTKLLKDLQEESTL